ncbi:copper homeostasis protein CutC [Guggenheimella bovis]
MFEIICYEIEDVRRLKELGPRRVELVRDLHLGGMTPPIELVKEAIDVGFFPSVMLRETTSFVLKEDDLKTLHKTMKPFLDLGVKHFVFGALKEDGSLDREALESFKPYGITMTFHRAIDESSRPLDVLRELEDFDFVKYVLTNGKGDLSLLKNMLESTSKRIILGGGVRIETLPEILSILSSYSFDIHMGTGVRTEGIDEHKVKQVEAILERSSYGT